VDGDIDEVRPDGVLAQVVHPAEGVGVAGADQHDRLAATAAYVEAALDHGGLAAELDVDAVAVDRHDIGTDGVPAGCLAGQPRAGQCNVYTPADFGYAAAQIAEETRHRAAQEANQPSTLNLNLIRFGCQITGPHANQSPDRFWCPTDRNDTYRNADYVGVYMKLNHNWLTGIFGEQRDIEDLSVIRIEPKRK
jgi:hypothetical protein